MGKLIWFSQIQCLCFILLHFQAQCSSLSPNSPPNLCRPQEYFALLDFNNTVSMSDDCAPLTRLWDVSTDCCSWVGITCDSMTGHVIGLDLSGFRCNASILTTNSSLFRLEKLQSLNLAYHNLNYSNISFGFRTWTSLTYLNLKDTGLLHGSLLFDISLLPKLVSLDLSENHGLHLQNTEFQMLVHNLTKLRSLSLDGVNMSLVLPLSFLNLTSTLEQLSLGSCSLLGNFPSEVFNLPSLQFLDLSQNYILEGNLPKSNWSSSLKSLLLDDTSFSGELPHSLGNLKLLEILSLYDCQFYGSIPKSLANLTEITSLMLGLNHLEGQIFDVFGKMHKLSTLNLGANNFDGELPASIFNLTHLIVLQLSSNNLSGSISPNMLSNLLDLMSLDLSHNSLLSLSNNDIVVNYTFPVLSSVSLSSCNIHKFPSFLNGSGILFFDVSNNKISGQIHKWEIEGMSFGVLNLSYNFLTGIDLFALQYVKTVDLRSNLLQGSLPIPPLISVSHPETILRSGLLISKNKLTGEIPHSLCNVSDLVILDLSWNSLGGNIPECLGNFSNLIILDLRMNKFHGRIPNFVPDRFSLRTLSLNGNQLEGILPRSLGHCISLKVLNVGNNYLNDTFPHWLGVLPELHVLILGSNRFHGAISNSMPAFYFPALRIIDVSHNDFMGLLPGNYFKNLKAIGDVHQHKADLYYIWEWQRIRFNIFSSDYYDCVTVIIKGNKVELVRILTIFTIIDFSSNRFHGEIPEELGELNSLILLNLSHNCLSGQIPSSLGKVSELESLDLSSNKLDGRIPEQLTSLTFLSDLNLSYNKLVGYIPEGKQFNTFSNDSYIRNSGLCGLPLTKKCNNGKEPEAPPSQFEDEYAPIFDWKFALMGYGCGVVLGVSLGYIVFTKGRPWWLVKRVEMYQQKFVGGCNRKRKIKRKIQQPN